MENSIDLKTADLDFEIEEIEQIVAPIIVGDLDEISGGVRATRKGCDTCTWYC